MELAAGRLYSGPDKRPNMNLIERIRNLSEIA